jgi:hypothetical protein
MVSKAIEPPLALGGASYMAAERHLDHSFRPKARGEEQPDPSMKKTAGQRMATRELPKVPNNTNRTPP